MSRGHAHRGRRDGNQRLIVQVLEGVNRVVLVLEHPLDLVVESRCACGRKGWLPMEVKNPNGRNRLTENQVAFIAMCEEKGLPIAVVRNDIEALEAVG